MSRAITSNLTGSTGGTMTLSEDAVERVIAAASPQLDPQDIEEIQSFLRHGEIELAFEGLVTSLKRINFHAPQETLRDLAFVARNLNLEDYPDGKGIYW
jgi:hypothetical protein